MPGVAEIRSIPEPDQESWEERKLPAPDGRRKLRFHSPVEFAMGAYFWGVTLLDEGRLVRHWSEAGDPGNVQPWSKDGDRLAFPLLSRAAGNRVFAATADGEELPAPDWPQDEYLSVLAWAPARGRLLLVGRESARLLDSEFREVAASGSTGRNGTSCS